MHGGQKVTLEGQLDPASSAGRDVAQLQVFFADPKSLMWLC